MFVYRVIVFGLLAAASLLLLSHDALAQGRASDLIRRHVYEGSKRPASQVATVFTTLTGDITYICGVDGKSVRQMGWQSSCPSVVYLLPGAHRLSIYYFVAGLHGEGAIPIKVAAGGTYKIHAKWTGGREALLSVKEMPAGFKLTYKDIAPIYLEKYKVPNAPVDPADAQ